MKKYWAPIGIMLGATIAFLYRLFSRARTQDRVLEQTSMLDKQSEVLVTRSEEVQVKIEQSNKELGAIVAEAEVKLKPRKVSIGQQVNDWNSDR